MVCPVFGSVAHAESTSADAMRANARVIQISSKIQIGTARRSRRLHRRR
jgi:hypothetical protein